jgi:prolycopene isomerase
MRFGILAGKDSIPLWHYSGVPSEKGLVRFFTDPKLKDIFASEELLIACLMPIGWAYTNNYQLAPQGGSQTLTHWMVRAASTFGARIHCDTRVTRILEKSGRIKGVEYLITDDNSGTISCPYIVAANDIISVLTNLLDNGSIKKTYIQKQAGADLYDSAVTVSLGLNVPSESLGFDESLITLTNSRQLRADHTCGDPAKSCLNILARSVTDKTLAPPGKGTLTIVSQAHMSYRNQWLTGPGLSRGQAYRDLKNEYAKILIDRTAAALCPGLRKHIELIDVATPITYWRYTGNHLGSIMGQRPTKRNVYSRIAGYVTPIAGLYRAGHWAEYGGGIPSAVRAAANSALHILKEENSDLFGQLASLLDGQD